MSNDLQYVLLIIAKIVCILVPLLFAMSYFTYAERKIIGYMQDRIGPNRVGPYGLFQPLADGLKLLLKELLVPQNANKYLFLIAPILTIVPALAAWAVIPFAKGLVLADINLGLLYIFAMSSMGVYGIIIAGWASNSKYAFLGALRAASQMISYEIAMGFALLGVIMAAKSMNLSQIVLAQSGGLYHWFCLPLLPLCVIYWICALAETNRAPFDVAEGESELVAGFHVEYSGITFAMFFLAEYMNMILLSFIAVIMFFGGWLSPFAGMPKLDAYFVGVPGVIWLLAKASLFMFSFLWIRATFPRLRYDQIMRLGWKVFVPLTFIWIIIEAFMVINHVQPWFY